MTQISAPKKMGSFEGRDVLEVEMLSSSGVRVCLLNYAALVRDWQVPVSGGAKRSVVCGFDLFEDYPEHSPYFGAIVGRVANRIGGSRFQLDGKEYRLPANEGPNHLHGGPKGFGKRIWEMEILKDAGAVKFSISSPDGDMGYPGRMEASATYRLDGFTLSVELEATADAATPVNLIQHNYFNLAADGSQPITGHRLWVSAERRLIVGADLVPTGEMATVGGTQLDFRQAKCLDDGTGAPLSVDNSLVLEPGRNPAEPVAKMQSPDGALTLKLWTDQPGLHVYTGGGMDIGVPGLGGCRYSRCGAVCLEDQNFPDAINHTNFPSSVLRPGQTYKHKCSIEIAPSK